jgi:hypothetical protein
LFGSVLLASAPNAHGGWEIIISSAILCAMILSIGVTGSWAPGEPRSIAAREIIRTAIAPGELPALPKPTANNLA